MRDKTILLVDDDSELLQSLKFFLKKKTDNVITATNGSEGYKAFFNNDVDVVISDIRMPEMDGVAMLRAIKEHKKNAKVILMTGFAEILETKSAYELGADDFLAKPFRMKELSKAIERCLSNDETSQKNIGLDKNYYGLDISEFIMGSKIDYPIFLRLSEVKYIRIGDRGEDLDTSRITRYKEKGVEKLYLIKTDYEKYLETTIKLTQVLSSKKVNIANSKKVAIIEKANNIIMDNVFSQDLDEETFEEAKTTFNTTMSIIIDIDDILKIINSLSEKSNQLYAHSVSVSMLAVMLTKKLGWVSERNRTLVAMGAMFHDIGKKTLPDDLIKKKLIEMNHEEKQELEKHTLYGVEILQQIPKIPNEIIQIALQHHENCNGTGYPSNIPGPRIHPLAKLITVVNEFVILTEQFGEIESQEEKFLAAIKRLIVLKTKAFEPDYFKKFLLLFSFGKDLLEELEYE